MFGGKGQDINDGDDNGAKLGGKFLIWGVPLKTRHGMWIDWWV